MADLYEFSVEWPSTLAQSVIVTGDFDQWSRSLSLPRSSANSHFAGTIKVPYGCPTRYKFIVDGEWKVKPEEPTELSPEGFLNNVYYVPLKSPLEALLKPKSSMGENGISNPAGNGNIGAEVDNDKLNISTGQAAKETTITSEIVNTETTSSQPLDKTMATPTPATSDLPATSPANGAVTNPESDATQPPDVALAPIIPMPIIPVNAKENCTIDPTKDVSNEDNIGTFVGIKPPFKAGGEKAEEEKKGGEEIGNAPEVIVTSPPVSEAPVEPHTEEVKEEKTSDVAPAQEETPTPTPEEVVKEEQQTSEAVPVEEKTPAPAPEEVKEKQTSAALPAQEEAPAPAPEPATIPTDVKPEEDVSKSEKPAEPKKEEEPSKVEEPSKEEPSAEASSATPTPDTQSTPKPPSKFVEGANGHTKTTSDTSTAVKPTSSPTTSSTAPGTTLAESVTSGTSAQGNKNTSEPHHKFPGGASGGDTKEFGVKEGKGSTRSGKKRKHSLFGSLRKMFHLDKDKKTNGSS